MAKFKGKNSIRKVAVLAKERAKYNLQAFPENEGMGPKQVVDFNFAEIKICVPNIIVSFDTIRMSLGIIYHVSSKIYE